MLSACSRPLQAGLLIGFVEGGENLDCGLGCRLGLFPFLVDFVWGVVSDRGLKPGLIAVGVQSMMLRPWGLFTGFFEFPQVAFCLEGVWGRLARSETIQSVPPQRISGERQTAAVNATTSLDRDQILDPCELIHPRS